MLRRFAGAGSGFFYGWVIVGLSALVNTLAWSVRATFALFYVALLAEFGWHRGEAAMGYALSWLLMLGFGPLAGRLYDRLGARLVVPVGGLLLGAGLAFTGRVQTLWQYYLCFGVFGAAGIACTMMPATAILSRWFIQARGTAMGIISAGASSSAVLFYPFTAWLIATLGWRQAIEVYGLIIVLGICHLTTLLYREQPADVGAMPDGRPVAATDLLGRQQTPIIDGSSTHEWTLRAALCTVPLWAVFTMWGLGVIGYQITATHQVAHALGQGFDPRTVAWVLGLSGAFTTAGNLIGGTLSDRWGREWVFTLGSCIGLVGIWCFSDLTGPHALVKLLLYAAAGIGFGVRISLLSTIPADLFHGKHFGIILGFVNGGGGLGGFIGPLLAGYLFDITGDYQLAFGVSALATAGSALAVWVARPQKARPVQLPSAF